MTLYEINNIFWIQRTWTTEHNLEDLLYTQWTPNEVLQIKKLIIKYLDYIILCKFLTFNPC
jgi:hypothetical protein